MGSIVDGKSSHFRCGDEKNEHQLAECHCGQAKVAVQPAMVPDSQDMLAEDEEAPAVAAGLDSVLGSQNTREEDEESSADDRSH